MRLPIIDPHLHLFARNHGDYAWLKTENAPYWRDKALIQRDFTEADFKSLPLIDVQAYVHIEAGFDNLKPWRELAWLEANCHIPMRCVAFLDLTKNTEQFLRDLAELEKYPSFVGVRHIIDDNVLQPYRYTTIINNLNILALRGLLFELQSDLTNQKSFDFIQTLLTKTNDLKISLNHAGFAPFNNPTQYTMWRAHIKQMAKNTNCYVKVSGFEMIDRDYTRGDIRKVLADCISEFGQSRVMLASNFPLLRFSTDYQNYWQTCYEICNELGLNASDLTLSNAQRFYGFI